MIVAALVAAAVLILDIATKLLIENGLDLHEAVIVTPFLNIVHVRNKGAAFGVFASFGNLFFIIIGVVAIVGILYYMSRHERERLVMAAILGGAIGNLIDRLRQGYVTDFLDVHVGDLHWPAFNVADSALTVGVVVLLIMSFRSTGHATKKDFLGDTPPSL